MSELSERGYECLRVAVNIARIHQVRKVSELRGRLAAAGFTPEVVEEALVFWAIEEQRKRDY